MNQREMAKILGVSQTTISMVLKDPNTRQVSDIKRRQITDYFSSVNYRSPKSTQLPLGNILLLVEGTVQLNDAYYLEFQNGVEQQATEYDLSLTIKCSRGNVKRLGNLPPRTGIIVEDKIPDEYLDTLDPRFPIVLLNYNYQMNCRYDVVIADHVAMLRTALQHLIERGHRRIALWGMCPMAGVRHEWHLYETVNAFQRTMSDFQLKCDADSVILPLAQEKSLEEIRREFTRTLKENLALAQPFTAYIATAYIYALEMTRAAAEMGIMIPEQLAVFSCGNVQACGYSSPPLTACDHDRAEMGRTAVDTLILRAKDPERPPKRILCSPRLTVRKST